MYRWQMWKEDVDFERVTEDQEVKVIISRHIHDGRLSLWSFSHNIGHVNREHLLKLGPKVKGQTRPLF